MRKQQKPRGEADPKVLKSIARAALLAVVDPEIRGHATAVVQGLVRVLGGATRVDPGTVSALPWDAGSIRSEDADRLAAERATLADDNALEDIFKGFELEDSPNAYTAKAARAAIRKAFARGFLVYAHLARTGGA